MDFAWQPRNTAGMPDRDVNLWNSPTHALEYLRRADSIPHRTEGEAELLEWLPKRCDRILDLGSGDGRLLALVKLARPESYGVAIDFSETMLGLLRERFEGDPTVRPIEHDSPGHYLRRSDRSTPSCPASQFITSATSENETCTARYTTSCDREVCSATSNT